MKFSLVFGLALSTSLASAKIVDPSQINERQTIDSQKATLLIFPDPASYTLTINELELTPMGEGSEGTIWKLTIDRRKNYVGVFSRPQKWSEAPAFRPE